MTPGADSHAARAQLEALDRRATRFATEAAPVARMVWRRWGEGAGPPLVLLHGGAGSWMHWVRNLDAFAAHHELWVPDLPGFGDSDLPREGLDADTMAPMVLAGARELLKGRPFTIVGFSYGALVGGYMALEAPDLVQRLVICGSNGMGLAIGPRQPLRSLRGVTDEREREAVVRHNLAAMMMGDPAHIDALAIAVQAASAPRERSRGRVLAGRDAMLPLAPRWRCPAFGVWGAHDQARERDPGAFDAAVASLGLVEHHVLPDAGHWVPYEGAEAFNPLVLRWLDAAVSR